MRAPTSTLIAARIQKGWTPEEAAHTPAPGRPYATEDRAHVSERTRTSSKGKRVTWHEAAIRLASGGRVYLRAYLTRAEAEAACAHYLATGEKPHRKTADRYRPPGGTKPRPVPETQPQPRQRAAAPQIERTPEKENRIAMIKAAWRRTGGL